MDPATPADALHLDPDTQPGSRVDAAPATAVDDDAPPPPSSAADEMRAVEHRLAIARNRMMRRLVEVSRRVDSAKAKMDVGRIIGDHPWPAVGIAAGVGGLLGLVGKRGSGTKTVPARMGALVGTLAFALVKDALSVWVKKSISNAVHAHGDSPYVPTDEGTAAAGLTSESPYAAYSTRPATASSSGAITRPELSPIDR